MSNILSQDEVDALLKGVQSGEIDTEAARERAESILRPYDFTSQERIIRGKMPGLEIMNERFARLFRNSISNLISRFVNVTIGKVEMTKFSEFMKTVSSPSSINILKINPLKGYALLVVETPLVFALVEFFFGGLSAQCVKSEGRSFTAIEQRIVKKVVTMALNDMASAWNGIAEIQPEHIGSETNPQLVNIVTPSEIVVKIEFNIEIEEFGGKFSYCIPYSMVEPLKDKLSSGIQSDKFEIDQRWATWLREVLMEARLEVCAELGKVSLPCEELLKFEVGSVISLGRPTTDELPIKVGGLTKMYGLTGHCRGNQAVKITKTMRKGDLHESE